MQIISKTLDFKIKEPTAVVLGKFDGVHKGHQLLLQSLYEQKANGLKTVVFTFDRSLSGLFAKESTSYGEICTLEEKREVFLQYDVDVVIEFPMDEETKNIPAEEFITKILQNKLNCKMLIAGEDITFGKKGLGDCKMLVDYKRQCGYEVIFHKKLKTNEIGADFDAEHGEEISSTVVRKCIVDGKIERANMLMGRAFCVKGPVVHGRQLAGGVLEMPTANVQWTDGKVLPAFGVYFTKIIVEDMVYYGVTNVGQKPTVETSKHAEVLAETYLFNFSGNLYDKEMTVQFYKFVRPEQKFSDLNALKEQLHKDMEEGRIFWSERTIKNVGFSK